MWGFSTTGPSVGLVVALVLLATTAAQSEQAGCSIDDNTTLLGSNQTLHQTDIPSFPFPAISTLINVQTVVTSMWNFANQLMAGMFLTGNGSGELGDMTYFRNTAIETSSASNISMKHTKSHVLRQHDTLPADMASHETPHWSHDGKFEREMNDMQISGLEVMIAESNAELKKIDMILEKLDLIQQLELSVHARPSLQDATLGLIQSYKEERSVLTHSILDLEQRLAQATRKKLDKCHRLEDGRCNSKFTVYADEKSLEAGDKAAAAADGSVASHKTQSDGTGYPVSIYRPDKEESPTEVCNFTDSPISIFEFVLDAACTPGYDCPPHTVHIYITRPLLIASFFAEGTQASGTRDPFMYKPFIQNFPVEVYIPKSWTDIVLENWLAWFTETCVIMYQFFIVVKKCFIRRFRRKRSRVRRER